MSINYKLPYNEVKDWDEVRIDEFLLSTYGARLKPEPLRDTTPIYDGNGLQLKSSDGKPRVMRPSYVEAINAHTTAHLDVDPSQTHSSFIAHDAHNMLATDTFLVINDGYMILALRTKFGPASLAAPGTALISSGGFAKHAANGMGETNPEIAIRVTRNILGIDIAPAQLMKSHESPVIGNRQPHYPLLELENGIQFTGVRPATCVQYLIQSPLSSKELIDCINLDWESDGVVFVPIEAGIKLWSGARDVANAVLYASKRIDQSTLNPAGETLSEVFAHAEQMSRDRAERYPLSCRAIGVTLMRDDSTINGSSKMPCENLLRVSRMAHDLG